MKKIIFLLITLMAGTLSAGSVLTFFLRPYPTAPNKTKRRLQRPGAVADDTFRALKKTKIHTGIVTSYGGNVEVSDVNGQVTFVRLGKPEEHELEKPELDLLVTPGYNAIPIRMIDKIVHHWELIDPDKAQMFHATRQQDPATELVFWNVQPTSLPDDKIIDIRTLILFANPNEIFIPVGATLAVEQKRHSASDEPTPNLMLPPLYVKKGIKRITNALSNLSLRQFFGPVDSTHKREKTRYTHQPKPR